MRAMQGGKRSPQLPRLLPELVAVQGTRSLAGWHALNLAVQAQRGVRSTSLMPGASCRDLRKAPGYQSGASSAWKVGRYHRSLSLYCSRSCMVRTSRHVMACPPVLPRSTQRHLPRTASSSSVSSLSAATMVAHRLPAGDISDISSACS